MTKPDFEKFRQLRAKSILTGVASLGYMVAAGIILAHEVSRPDLATVGMPEIYEAFSWMFGLVLVGMAHLGVASSQAKLARSQLVITEEDPEWKEELGRLRQTGANYSKG